MGNFIAELIIFGCILAIVVIFFYGRIRYLKNECAIEYNKKQSLIMFINKTVQIREAVNFLQKENQEWSNIPDGCPHKESIKECNFQLMEEIRNFRS